MLGFNGSSLKNIKVLRSATNERDAHSSSFNVLSNPNSYPFVTSLGCKPIINKLSAFFSSSPAKMITILVASPIYKSKREKNQNKNEYTHSQPLSKKEKKKRQGGAGNLEVIREYFLKKQDSPPLLAPLKPLQQALQPDAPPRSPE